MKSIFRKYKKVIIILILIFLFSCLCPSYLLTLKAFDYNKSHEVEESEDKELVFPEGFLWGAATAAYQVEGGNVHSNWWEFEQTEGAIKNGDRNEVGVDHYHKYEEDFDILEELNLNTYRFSISWSRIEPEKGKFDQEEIEHYRGVLQSLHKRNITPMVTLWHHSLPLWFQNEGGWENEKSIEYYTEYVRFVVEALGEDVDLWLTMNEPMAYITTSYISAKWPPKEKSYYKVPKLFSRLTSAHRKAYETIHEIDEEAQVGLAEHSSYVVPYNEKNILENDIAFSIDYMWTHFLLSKIKKQLDFIGVHYYYQQSIRLGLVRDVLTKEPEEIETESLDRLYYPKGIFEVLMRFKEYEVPIYLTEIGVPDYHEIDRDQFIEEHAKWVYYAIQEGVDVRGFYYWALLDSFEWTEGFDAKFGLVAVDLNTLERTIKSESYEYADIAKCNCVRNKIEK